MGCTSSAQNTVPSLANSDKDESTLQETDENPIKTEKGVALEKSNEWNGIKVLPMTCDTDRLDEPTHLDRHSKLVDTADLDFETDTHANAHNKERKNENLETNQLVADTSETEDRLSHLEEVVERVVILYENGELEITTEPEQTSKDTQTKDDPVENQQGHISAEMEESVREVASPSESQSSRATRWEALADIAAELPPSLAVDHLTGQIYALSK